MNGAQKRRIEALLGTPLPEDHRLAVKVLRQAINATKDSRRQAELTAARLAVITAATEAVNRDRRLRTSPELERLRGFGEQLQLRLQRARHTSDDVMIRLAAFSDWVHNGGLEDGEPENDKTRDSPPNGEQEDELVDPSSLPGVRAMRKMIDAHSLQRSATDRIGRNNVTVTPTGDVS